MRLDVVIPAHNEARRIDKTLHAYRSSVTDPMTRFIVALDRCTDETAAVVESHARVDERVEVMQYPKLGKGGVLMEAFRQCQADLVGFVDADCSTPPAEFLRLVEAVDGDGEGAPADVVIATRFHPTSVLPARRSTARRMTSMAFSALVRLLFGLPCSDTQCGAKVMRKGVLVDALPLLSSRDFLFDVDLLVVADRLGFRIVEVPTVWLDRGGSHIDPVADGRRMAASALRLWLHHRVIPLPEPTSDRAPVTRHRDGSPATRRRHWDSAPAHLRDPRAPRDPPAPRDQRDPRRGRRPARRQSRRQSADVAMVTPFPTVSTGAGIASGVTAYASRLTRALANEGMKVEVVAPRLPGEPSRSELDGVAVTRAYRPGPWAVPAALAAAVRTGAPVVHLQHETFLYGGLSSVPGLFPGLAALRSTSTGCVVTLHQVVDPSDVDSTFTSLHRVRVPPPLARAGLAAVQSAAEALADRTIVHEQALGRFVPSADLVHLGVERRTPLPMGAARRRLGLDPERLVVLCFGFLAPYKGLEAVLEAAELAGPRVALVLAGGEHPRLVRRDPYADALRARFGGVARFTGYVEDEDVAAWFSAADAVLVPYPRPFATSGAFAEALGYGRPVLCSPEFAACVGAPNEVVVPTEPRLLASRLLDLAEQPRALSAIAEATGRMAGGRTWESAARAHIRIYEEVIDAYRAAGRRLRTGEPR